MDTMQVLVTPRVLRPLVVVVLVVRAVVVLLTAPLAACSFSGPGQDLCTRVADAPLTQLTDHGTITVFSPGDAHRRPRVRLWRIESHRQGGLRQS